MRSTLGRSTWSILAVLAMSVATLGVVAPPTGAATTATLSIGNASVWEGNSGAVRLLSFSVALSQPVTTAVSVQYRLVTGTATTADFDNLGGVTKTLTFPAGATTRFVAVSVKPDTLDETNETFTVSLSNPTGATLRNSSAIGTILDDDPGSGVRLGIGDVAVSEGDSGPAHLAGFWVTLSQPATAPVSAHAMTMSGSATEGVDYTGNMATLTFAPGEIRKAFMVAVKPDTTVEPDETFTVMLSNVIGATLADGTGVGKIISEERSALTTKSFLIGPFSLAANGQFGWQNEATGSAPRPVGAIGIKGMRFDIVDQNGAPVGMHDVHLHHVVLLDHSRTDAVCPSLGFNRFSGSGMERTPLALGSDYAYRVGATDTWSALWHIMNMTNQAKQVYIKYDIDYVAATSPLAAKGVTTYWYDVAGCWGNSEFTVPGNGGPGSVYTLSRAYTAPRNGTRVGTGGHVHDGGIDITLRRGTASGTVVCTNTAMYDLSMLHSITACPTPSSVTAGEQFTTTVRYRNDQPIAGAMGIQLNYVWEP